MNRFRKALHNSPLQLFISPPANDEDGIRRTVAPLCEANGRWGGKDR